MTAAKKHTIPALLLAAAVVSVSSSSAETLHWNECSDSDLAGYHIYIGTESGVYTDTLDVGDVTRYCLTGLDEGETYYFSVSSYDNWGNESDLSPEVSYMVSSDDAQTGVGNEDTGAPQGFILEKNYPNPFNPETHIAYAVDRPGRVRLVIYTVTGRKVRVLVDKMAGQPYREEVVWNGTDELGRSMPSGMYLYRLEQEHRNKTSRMVLAR